MNNIKKLLIVILGLMPVMTVRAQYTGDLVISVLRTELDNQIVELSFENPIPNACYKWEGHHINGSPTTPTITANPQGKDLNLYICTCITEEEVIQQTFWVQVVDTVLIDVTPQSNCFQRGQELSLNDFYYEVYPTDYEALIDFYPRQIPDDGLSANVGEGILELTFFIDVDNKRFEQKLLLPYIDPTHQVNGVGGINVNNIVETFKKCNSLKKKLEGGANALERLNYLLSKAPGVGPSLEIKKGEIKFGEITISEGKYQCCNDKKIGLYPIVWDGLSAGISAEGSFTWPTPVPGLLALVKAGVGASVTVGKTEFDYCTDSECISSYVAVSFDANAMIAAGVSILNPDIVSAYLSVEGKASLMGKLIIPQLELSNSDLILNVTVKATVEALFGIFEDHYEWNMFQVKLF